MRKFLIFTFGLLAAFLLVNMLYIWTLARVDWEFSKTREAFNFRQQNHKILVFGNSTAMDGVDTEALSRQFGPSYNFAVGGASLETNYIQMEHYLKNNAKPEKVLLFLSSCHINYDKANDVNPIIDHYYTDSLSGIGLKELPLFKFRWLFVENVKKLLSSGHRSAQVVNGQLRINKTVPDNTANGTTAICIDSADYSRPGYRYLHRIAAACEREDIELVIFEMPCWKRSQNHCPDLAIRGISKAVRVFNLNRAEVCDSLLNPQTDWLSENHLNQHGAGKVTRHIEKILNANVAAR